ncbi:hypothetical protein V1511DRAFT_350558 [Dipodascopsis uninucleata]
MYDVRIGPDLPPHLLAARRARMQKSSPVEGIEKETASTEEQSDEHDNKSSPYLGPSRSITQTADTLNRATLAQSVESDVEDENESSSEDDFGPSIPKNFDEEQEEREAEARMALIEERDKMLAASKSYKSKREEWMLVPPPEGHTGQIDPTKLRNKKFLSGRAAGSSIGAKHGADTSWLETESERKKRLSEEMMGLRNRASDEDASRRNARLDRKNAETAKLVEEYTERNRGKSLLETYQERKNKSGSGNESLIDDPSKRPFDYQKDIASGGKILSSSKLQEMAKRAGSIDSKFSDGGFV